jgi:hypothetical protein
MHPRDPRVARLLGGAEGKKRTAERRREGKEGERGGKEEEQG